MSLMKSTLATKKVQVWSTRHMEIPYYHRCTTRVVTPIGVEWDPDETDLVSATLVIEDMISDHDPSYMEIFVNGYKQDRFTWHEGQKNQHLSGRVNVLGPLQNGSNTFEVDYCKSWLYPGKSIGQISAYLELSYSGEDPYAGKGWLDKLREWMEDNWYIPTIAVIFLAIVSTVSSRRRYHY